MATARSTAGWGVTEVWEAQENWDSWYEGTVKPNLPEGIEPRIATRELYDVVQRLPAGFRFGQRPAVSAVNRGTAPVRDKR
jgi:hypothetical protein